PSTHQDSHIGISVRLLLDAKRRLCVRERPIAVTFCTCSDQHAALGLRLSDLDLNLWTPNGTALTPWSTTLSSTVSETAATACWTAGRVLVRPADLHVPTPQRRSVLLRRPKHAHAHQVAAADPFHARSPRQPRQRRSNGPRLAYRTWAYSDDSLLPWR